MAQLNPKLVDWLNRWGDWQVRGCRGLGYPSSTTTWKAYHNPGRSNQKPQAPGYSGDAVASGVNAAIETLEADHQLYLYYVYAQHLDGLRLARLLKQPRGTVRYRIERAHQAIADYYHLPLHEKAY